MTIKWVRTPFLSSHNLYLAVQPNPKGLGYAVFYAGF
jgi:hypothetical protein